MNTSALKDAVAFFDDFLQYRFPYLNIPSLSIAASYESKLLYARTLGSANLEANQAATPDTLYRVASNSKMFTSVAILQLQEAGLLQLDDKIEKFLPWLNSHTDKRWKEVTVRQLLSHSAGVARDSSRSGFWSLQYPFPTQDQIREVILADKLVYDPNVFMKYSNYGFSLLGEIIQKASDVPYNDYVQKNIIQKAKLTHTAPEYNLIKKGQNLAVGYTSKQRDGRRLPIDHVSTHGLSPATGLASTPTDLCRFLDCLHDGKLISIASLREMSRIHSKVRYGKGTKQFYGLGLEIGEAQGRFTVGHGGGFPGQVTTTLHLPDDRLSVSVTCNTRDLISSKAAHSFLATAFWFNQNHVTAPRHDLTRFTVRTGTFWGENEILGYGNSLISLYSGFPLDFEHAERLERTSDTTVKVVNTSSFANPGEPLRYHFKKDGTIDHIDDQGTTLVPAWRRDEKWAGQARISLEK